MATSAPWDDGNRENLRPVTEETDKEDPQRETKEMGMRRKTGDGQDGLGQGVAAEMEIEDAEEGRQPRAGAIPSMPSNGKGNNTS